MHAFLKIPRPVDIPGPLESEFPIIPILFVLCYASRNSSTLFLLADIEILLDPHQAVLRTYQVTPQVWNITLLARVCSSCSSPSKQLIFVTSHMPLRSATGICGVSLASGTAVHSVPRTFAQTARCSTPTIALTFSSYSRLPSLCRRPGTLSHTPANPHRS